MSYRLQVLIPETLDTRVAKAAARLRLSKGEWVRQALERALKPIGDASNPVEKMAALNAPTADIDQMLVEISRGRKR